MGFQYSQNGGLTWSSGMSWNLLILLLRYWERKSSKSFCFTLFCALINVSKLCNQKFNVTHFPWSCHIYFVHHGHHYLRLKPVQQWLYSISLPPSSDISMQAQHVSACTQLTFCVRECTGVSAFTWFARIMTWKWRSYVTVRRESNWVEPTFSLSTL